MVKKSQKNSTCVVLKLVWCFRQGTNKLCLSKYGGLANSSTDLPKGHLIVCVGESEDEKQRVLVPVTHFNHPLLGKLLEDAEKVYGSCGTDPAGCAVIIEMLQLNYQPLRWHVNW
ncbi:hypothetical protein V8G54_000461 [Vigna mungo]|uniref:Uncharacterized protein n=1 Tax=Vigna mungo TaxID=3915 RepID=A0AAQ3S8Z6_VIGMU